MCLCVVLYFCLLEIRRVDSFTNLRGHFDLSVLFSRPFMAQDLAGFRVVCL